MKDNELIPFEGKEIRKVWHDEQWYFSVVNVIEVLTDSAKPSNYWNMLKKREPQVSTICVKLKLKGQDGKNYPSDCANTEGVFRIIMSIPSPKAEPLKLWLAEQGKRAIDEAEDPELSFDRAREIYKAKGYPDDWIGYREKSITVRKELTEEWQKRGVKESSEYSILTAQIAKETFGLTPSEHGKLKGLEKQNLRDHMTTLELLFSALGEEVTRQIAITDNTQGFMANQDAAIQGGRFAGNAIERLEKEKNIKVVSSQNYLGVKGGDKPDELPPDDKKD
ncbi:MAG: Bro-N domain-containing protein [Saprospiraceae bacterium]|nr:Bro-N domain-containing protein [Saprospiraceae bacterium]